MAMSSCVLDDAGVDVYMSMSYVSFTSQYEIIVTLFAYGPQHYTIKY